MTFEEWYKLLLSELGKSPGGEQDMFMKIFIETAWNAGYNQRSRELSESEEERETGHHGFTSKEDR